MNNEFIRQSIQHSTKNLDTLQLSSTSPLRMLIDHKHYEEVQPIKNK